MWAEKVLRLCSMLCSSPMSAKTSSNTASSDPSDAGMCRPALAQQGKDPTVFRETVLPPVFGPETIEQVETSASADADIDRNHFFRVNERVASFLDADAALLIEIRFRTAVKQRELCACKDKIEFG